MRNRKRDLGVLILYCILVVAFLCLIVGLIIVGGTRTVTGDTFAGNLHHGMVILLRVST